MRFSFRIGTTSYIKPDNLVANANFLADKIKDMELVLFDLEDGTSNLPSMKTIEQLNALATRYDLSYTVHLPQDICPNRIGEQLHASMLKAYKTITATRALKPWAYIVHLDGRIVRDRPAPSELSNWQADMVRAIQLLGDWAGGLENLAVENLEGYPPDFVRPVVEQVGVARCVDLGHYWLDGIDPLPYLQTALPRTRVIHLHGINGRDHQSLAYIPLERLEPVLELLLVEKYTGVLTMEIFGEQDFLSSIQYLQAVLGQY